MKTSFRDILIPIYCVFSALFFLVFISYSPADPGWTYLGQDSVTSIHNIGGLAGARVADIFLSIFGYMSYTVPIMLLYFSWRRYRRQPLDIVHIIGGWVLILLSGGALCSLHIANAIPIPVSTGGLSGAVISYGLLSLMTPEFITTLALLGFVSGLAIVFNLSWLALCDRVGHAAWSLAERIISRKSANHHHVVADGHVDDDESVVIEERDAETSTTPAQPSVLKKITTLFRRSVKERSRTRHSSRNRQEPTLGDDFLLSRKAFTPERKTDSLVSVKNNEDFIQNFLFAQAHLKGFGDLPDNVDPEVAASLTEEVKSYGFNHPKASTAEPICTNQTTHSLPNTNQDQHNSLIEQEVPNKRTPLDNTTDEVLPQPTGFQEEIPITNAVLETTSTNQESTHQESAPYNPFSNREPQEPTDRYRHQSTSTGNGDIAPSLEQPTTAPEALVSNHSFGTDASATDSLKVQGTDPYEQDDNRVNKEANPYEQNDNRVNKEANPYEQNDNRGNKKTDPYGQNNNRVNKETNPYEQNDNRGNKETDPYGQNNNRVNKEASPYEQDDNTISDEESDYFAVLEDNQTAIPVDHHDRNSTLSEKPEPQPSGPRKHIDYKLPTTNLLTSAGEDEKVHISPQLLQDMGKLLEQRLNDYNVKAKVVAINPGPVITRFEVQPAAGVKVIRIANLAKDLARSLTVSSVRVVEVIPGKSTVGIEIPNKKRQMVRLGNVINSDAYRATGGLPLALGDSIEGHATMADLAKMPHLLVAGTTGSGKSVGVNAMLISILFKLNPSEVRMILIDPKMLELSVYNGIPHLLTPVITDMKDAANGLRWCVAEMERRYRLMSKLGVRNLEGYNNAVRHSENGIADPLYTGDIEDAPMLQPLPFLIVVIDEFADMMMIVGKKVEELIARIAQKARAAGIHLILATQRPSVDVITGLIKANIPTRIAFQVSSKIDSRTILDQAGADQLLGHGDMLYLPPGSGVPQRVHGAFVSDEEVHKVVDFWKNQDGPEYINDLVKDEEETTASKDKGQAGQEEQDDLYSSALEFVIETQRVSISYIQRKLKIGYNRAARIIETMEEQGVVSSMESNGKREVLISRPDDL